MPPRAPFTRKKVSNWNAIEGYSTFPDIDDPYPPMVVLCPICRHKPSFLDDKYCRHPLTVYGIGREIPYYNIPKTLSHHRATPLPDWLRRTEEELVVPIPRHCNDCSESRAKRMLTSINNQRNWGADRLRQWFVDGGYYHPDKIELAFPPGGWGGGWRHILNVRREKREAFIIDNLARQLENEGPAGGGHRPRRRVCSDDEEEDWD